MTGEKRFTIFDVDGCITNDVERFGIPTLADAAHPDTVLDAAAGSLDVTRLRSIDSVQLISVHPNRRCVFAYCGLSIDGARRPIGLIGKIRTKGLDRRVVSLSLRLRSLGFREDGDRRFAIAEPIGTNVALGLTLYRQYHGPTLEGCVVGRSPPHEDFENVGRALRELHDLGASTDRRHTTEDELRILDRDLTRACREIPAERARIERLLALAHSARKAIMSTHRRSLHRDFHPQQVLVDSAGLILLDLDLYAMGDPRIDVSNFAAHLRELAYRMPALSDKLAIAESAFYRGYFGSAPNGEILRSMAPWMFFSLMRQIWIAWRIEDRRRSLPEILRECEALSREID